MLASAGLRGSAVEHCAGALDFCAVVVRPVSEHRNGVEERLAERGERALDAR